SYVQSEQPSSLVNQEIYLVFPCRIACALCRALDNANRRVEADRPTATIVLPGRLRQGGQITAGRMITHLQKKIVGRWSRHERLIPFVPIETTEVSLRNVNAIGATVLADGGLLLLGLRHSDGQEFRRTALRRGKHPHEALSIHVAADDQLILGTHARPVA